MTKTTKNMVAILLNKTIFTFPICNPLYDRWGGGGGKPGGENTLFIYKKNKKKIEN